MDELESIPILKVVKTPRFFCSKRNSHLLGTLIRSVSPKEPKIVIQSFGRAAVLRVKVPFPETGIIKIR